MRRILALLVAGVLASCAPSPTPVRTGAPAPRILAASAERPTVFWVFDGESLGSCRSAAYVLRHATQEFAHEVDFAALAVDADPTDAAAFLRTERLPLQLRHLTPAEYRSSFAEPPAPTLYVVERGIIRAVLSAPTRETSDRKASEALASVLRSVLRSRGAARVAHSPSTTPP